MSRVLSSVVVCALLAATAVAFAIAEGAKLTRSPIAGTRVSPVFSPNSAAAATRTALVRFRLRTRERLEVWIENGDGHRVETLLQSRVERRGAVLNLVWDGLDDQGIEQPDGVYMPVVKLESSHRTIVLPSPIRLDTVRPVITVKHPRYPIISPDGDGHGDVFRIPYTTSKPAHAILFVQRRQLIFTLGQKQRGVLVWNGKVKTAGGKVVRAKPGRYLLSIAAQDRAGNRSKPYPFAIAQVRFVVLARTRVVVKAGAKFAIRVSTDAPQIAWRLNGGSGVERSGTLHFRAPKKAGTYRLYVSAAGHAAKCVVVVR